MICPIMIFAASYLWYSCFALYPIAGSFITQFIQSILMLTIILFVIGFIYGLFNQKNNDPAAQLNHEGIRVKYFGFIAWSEIEELSEYQFQGVSVVGIGIRVHDLKSLSKQAAFSGKLGIFWSKIFGYPPIIIANIVLDNEQVITYAKRFIKE